MIATELDRLASHPFIATFVRSLALQPGRELEVDESVRRAAILLAVRARSDGEPELLMIKRAEFESDPWSGHVACPGGRMEPRDHDLAETAARETLEETGIDIARDGRMLGHLDDLTPRTPLLPPIVIRPFVALVRTDLTIVLSREVASAFWVPIEALREPTAWGRGVVPARAGGQAVSTFQHGEHTVWGLTERVLRQFVDYVS